MICPKDNLECAKPQVCNAGRLCATPPPDMAEIERLVDAFRVSVRDSERWQNPYCEIEESNVRAALIAAIRQLNNSAQNGE